MSARLHRSQNAAAWGADLDARDAERRHAAEQDATTPPRPNPQGTHHWVLSVQWSETRRRPRRTVVESANYGATTTPKPGETRADVYDRIRNHVYNDLARTAGVDSPTVVFWSLEPNQLAADTAWPENVETRYRTLGGSNVDVAKGTNQWKWTCRACPATSVGAYTNPFGEPFRYQDIHEQAQDHASRCRAMPKPGGAA